MLWYLCAAVLERPAKSPIHALGLLRRFPPSSPPAPPSPSPASSRWLLLLFFYRGMEDDSISPHERRQIEHIRALELEELQVEEVDDTRSSSDDNGCVHIYHYSLRSMLMLLRPPRTLFFSLLQSNYFCLLFLVLTVSCIDCSLSALSRVALMGCRERSFDCRMFKSSWILQWWKNWKMCNCLNRIDWAII